MREPCMHCFNLVIEVLFFSSFALHRLWVCLFYRFNLVIEVLFFSSTDLLHQRRGINVFQSRNRGSFLFKLKRDFWHNWHRESFNLVIEVLFFSSRWIDTYGKDESCFNLVIEVLFFSSFGKRLQTTPRHCLFQSRNRGSFLFKVCTQPVRWYGWILFQSRNRGSFLFKPSTSTLRIPLSVFQSRNRGSFLFKPTFSPMAIHSILPSFNLVIEVLFFSSKLGECCCLTAHFVSIS